MSAGTMMIAGGLALLGLAVLTAVWMAATASGSRKRIEERMREKY